MSRKFLSTLIVTVLISFILINISTVIRDFFEVYMFSFNHLSITYFINVVSDKNTYLNFFTILDPINAFSWFLIGTYILSSIFDSFSSISLRKQYSLGERYGSHGTSRWANRKEIKKYFYKDKVGWVLGHTSSCAYKLDSKIAYHPVDNDLNMQLNVVGPPNTNKTTGLVLPNILHISNIYSKLKEHADLIITDPKTEIFSHTANFLKEKGYEIKVLDFVNLKYGDTLNILDFITTEKELIEIADGYVRSVEASLGSESKDKFWAEQEGQALGALIGAVKQTRSKDNQTFYEALRILTDEMTSYEGSINMVKAKQFFIDNNVSGAALQLWKNFLMFSKSENTAGNILGGLAGKLKLFAIDGIKNLTGSTTIDISKIGAKKDKPIALFIFMPDGDRTFSPIINTVITTLFNQLYKTAYKYNNTLPNPVYFILEEAANIGYIPSLQEKLGTMRGRRIYPMMIWQSLSQMKDRYPRGWEDILSMCDTHLYLGVNDEFTAKYISEQLGETTIQVQGFSQRADGGFGKSGQTESYSYQRRKLLFKDEAIRLDPKVLIVRQRGRYPVKLIKVQYKFWEDDKKVCDFKPVNELPLLNSSANKNLIVNDIKVSDNEETEKVHKLKEKNESKEKVEVPNKDNIKTADKDLELDTSVLHELEKELIKDRDTKFR